MKILLLFAISVSVAFATSEISPAIVSNAQPGEFPFVASLQLFVFGQSSHFCAAVIIGNIWLLTVNLRSFNEFSLNDFVLGCKLYNVTS